MKGGQSIPKAGLVPLSPDLDDEVIWTGEHGPESRKYGELSRDEAKTVRWWPEWKCWTGGFGY